MAMEHHSAVITKLRRERREASVGFGFISDRISDLAALSQLCDRVGTCSHINLSIWLHASGVSSLLVFLSCVHAS